MVVEGVATMITLTMTSSALIQTLWYDIVVVKGALHDAAHLALCLQLRFKLLLGSLQLVRLMTQNANSVRVVVVAATAELCLLCG